MIKRARQWKKKKYEKVTSSQTGEEIDNAENVELKISTGADNM